MWRRLKKEYTKSYYYFFPLTRLKLSGAKVGSNVFWGDSNYVELENAKLLKIEDDVVVAAHSKFVLHDSSLNNVLGNEILYGEIILRKNCYIGANTILLPGTIIGENTIIGANSLVKGIYKPNSVYFGTPAKYYCSITKLSKNWISRKSDLVFFENNNYR